MQIKIKKLNPKSVIPTYDHPGDAGANLYSLEDKLLKPGERHIFGLGFALEFDEKYVVLFLDRSGLAGKFGLTTLGGVIDAGYRGECKVVLANFSNKDYQVKKGDRIAQMVVQRKESAFFMEVDELSGSVRGAGSFGSTGR